MDTLGTRGGTAVALAGRGKAARIVKGEAAGSSFLNKSYDEVHVFGGVAERTGNQVDREGVRGRRAICGSVTDLGAKVRRLGDGYYYLATGVWPDRVDTVDLNQAWIPIG